MVARHGLPESRADLSRHVFVSYIEELAGFPEMMALDQIVSGAPIAFRASSSAAQSPPATTPKRSNHRPAPPQPGPRCRCRGGVGAGGDEGEVG